MSTPLDTHRLAAYETKAKYPFGYNKPTQIHRTALRDIGNHNLRRVLSDEISNDSGRLPISSRVVSQPTPEDTPRFLSHDTFGQRPSLRAVSLSSRKPFDYDAALRRSATALKQPPARDLNIADGDSPSLIDNTVIAKEKTPDPPTVTLPTHTSLEPLTTSLLHPQTQKTSAGQISILPQSRSLLVDFREGERRRGQKGNEVLVVSADGVTVKIYSAPHLSSPCCLVEALAEHTLNQLPERYHRTYQDAFRIVQQLKERTPRLVMHMDHAKCTLMANEPLGTIEVSSDLVDSPQTAPMRQMSASSRTSKGCTSLPSVRLRLQRHSSITLDISRHLLGADGSSQTNQTNLNLHDLDDDTWEHLLRGPQLADSKVKTSVRNLLRFLRICQNIESSLLLNPSADEENQSNSYPGLARTCSDSRSSRDRTAEVRPPPEFIKTSCRSSPFATERRPRTHHPSGLVQGGTNESSSFRSAPRISRPNPPRRSSPFSSDATIMHPNTFRTKDLDFESLLKGSGNVIQTRFKDGIGWCIRTGATGSQGGRYKIMFLDGAALEVDADDEWVEFKDDGGQISRIDIQDCVTERRIGDRLKAFAEFVSMFDEAEAEH